MFYIDLLSSNFYSKTIVSLVYNTLLADAGTFKNTEIDEDFAFHLE